MSKKLDGLTIIQLRDGRSVIMTQTKKKILDLIYNKPGITTSVLVRRSKVSIGALREHLKQLAKQKMIKNDELLIDGRINNVYFANVVYQQVDGVITV